MWTLCLCSSWAVQCGAGISVTFPFEPYECQRAFMRNVVEAMETRRHAVLESPTGTGKTLCLLAATLEWLRARRGPAPARDAEQPGGGRGPVVYASRTHAQLSQAVRALRSTSYSPQVAVIASREQLCGHQTVSKLKGAVRSVPTRQGNRHLGNHSELNLEWLRRWTEDSHESSNATRTRSTEAFQKTDRTHIIGDCGNSRDARYSREFQEGNLQNIDFVGDRCRAESRVRGPLRATRLPPPQHARQGEEGCFEGQP